MSNLFTLAAGLAEDEPGMAAAALLELEPSAIAAFLAALPGNQGPQILAELPSPLAASCLEMLPAQQSAIWLQTIGYPLKTRIARAMSFDALSRILAEIPKSSARQISQDIAYLPDSVGAWIEESACVVQEDETVGDCLMKLRRQRQPLEHALVITGKGGRYGGLVSLGALVKAPDKILVGTLADRFIPALNPDTTLIEAAERTEWNTHLFLPVSGKRGSFLGILKVERLRNVLEHETSWGAVSGSGLIIHLLEAALISATGMARLFPGAEGLREIDGGEERID